jgi:hypothetical protein
MRGSRDPCFFRVFFFLILILDGGLICRFVDKDRRLWSIFGCQITWLSIFFFFIIIVGCLGQLARTTTIPHGPLNILQA